MLSLNECKNVPGLLLEAVGACSYEVKAVLRQGTQLRATIRAFVPEMSHLCALSTIDLYSHRSRQWFAGLCTRRLNLDEATVAEDIQALIPHVEQRVMSPCDSVEVAGIELTDAQQQSAERFLAARDLMDKITTDLGRVGYVGEVNNKQLAYLVATSRKLDRPLSLLIESRSGAGKSALQDAVVSCMPPEECLKYSRITQQALFYGREDGLDGKLLALEEAAGMGGAAYSIRALQSAEALRVAATGKDPVTGRMQTEEYEVKARTAVMMTTTQPDLDEETKNRFICTTVDETSEATQQILQTQRHADTLEGIASRKLAERIRTSHQNVQRQLKPIAVANPFAPRLTFPTLSLTARRDNKKYLDIIKAIAFLHQRQREKHQCEINGEPFEYIEVELSDIAMANRIAQAVLVKHHDVTPQAQKLFGLIRQMLVNGGGAHGKLRGQAAGFNRRRVREFTGWSDWQLRTHLNELVELEYISVRQGRNGKEYIYELDDTHLLESLPGFGLTEPDAIKEALNDHKADHNLAVILPNLEANSPNLTVP